MPKKTNSKSKASSRRKVNRREARDLDIEIGFLEGVVRRDPGYEEALQVLGDNYTRRGRFNEGLKIDERLARLRPEDSLVRYTLACSYALNDQMEQAAGALEDALDLGYCDFKWLDSDPDLARLRRHPAYRKIKAKVESMQIKID